ncbi:MAG: methyl-accepting chemotaxis protein [Chitinispirillaceae bacterium]|nr:methyl-accepting chemotaxis protein [Chitinispirillaceae bacterium]
MKLRLGHKMVLVGLIPLAAFTIVGIREFSVKYGEYKIMNEMLLNIKLAKASSVLIRDLQRERGRTSLFLAGGSGFDDIKKLQSETDDDIVRFQATLDRSAIDKTAKERYLTIARDLGDMRPLYSRQEITLRKQQVSDYTMIIRSVMQLQSDIARTKTTGGFGKVLTSLCLLEEARENAGLLRANISSLLSIDKELSDEDFSYVLGLKAGVDANLFSPALAMSKNSIAKLDSMRQSQQWKQIEEMVQALIIKAVTGNFGVSGDTFFKMMTEKIDGIGEIIEKEVTLMEQRASNEKSVIVRSFTALTSFLILIIIAVAVLIWNIAGTTRMRLGNLNKLLTEISMGEGDLTRRLDVKGGDEITEMAASFNMFVDKIDAIVKKVKSSAAMVSSSVQSLNQAAIQVSESARSTADLNSVASSAEQTTERMNNTSHYMKRTNESLESVAAATEQMSTTIADVAENAQKAMTTSKDAATQARDVAEQIRVLGDAVREIGTVTETIANISAQTNLLALNATIEAARAGVAGKGFAVVANEIKTLAEQTAEATGDIRTKIVSIQNLTGTTVDEVQKIDGIVKNVDEIISMIATAIEEQAAVTKDVASNIARATDGAREAGKGVDETAFAAQNTADSINEISSSAADLKSASSSVGVASEELKQVAENLQDMVNKFKTN